VFLIFFKFPGTTYNGQWDGWYGPSERKNCSDDSNVANTVEAVSPATTCVSIVEPILIKYRLWNPTPENTKPYSVSCETSPKRQSDSIGRVCNPLGGGPCLFHIATDPCELYNLADTYPVLLNELWNKLLQYGANAKPARNSDM
jgi:hypothetical protein